MSHLYAALRIEQGHLCYLTQCGPPVPIGTWTLRMRFMIGKKKNSLQAEDGGRGRKERVAGKWGIRISVSNEPDMIYDMQLCLSVWFRIHLYFSPLSFLVCPCRRCTWLTSFLYVIVIYRQVFLQVHGLQIPESCPLTDKISSVLLVWHGYSGSQSYLPDGSPLPFTAIVYQYCV